jgi:hypothetical protein
MGWAWSPWICQVLGWLLILQVPPGEEDLFDRSKIRTDELPTHVRIKGGNGFVTLLYDNIGVFADKKDAERIAKRILCNLHFFHVVVKEHKFYHHSHWNIQTVERGLQAALSTGAVPSCQLPVHLGIQMGIVPNGRTPQFRWRVDPARIALWQLDHRLQPTMLARRTAQLIGRIVVASPYTAPSLPHCEGTTGRAAAR